MQCTACGASNPPGADWCNQCFAPAGGRVVAGQDPTGDTAPDSEVDGRSGPAPPGAGSDGAFRRRDGTVEWACPRCGTYTSVEEPVCQACGTPMTERFAGSEQPEHQPQQWTTALWLSVVAPGAGHLLVNRIGGGIARVLLFLVWVAGGWTLLQADGPGGPVAAPLLLGAAVIWAGSLADLVFLSRGGRELLGGRVLLWLVVGVTGLALLGALSGAALLTR